MTGGNILLVSPQAWSQLHISKHHYALTLVDLGFTVYFLNPARPHYSSIKISQPLQGRLLYIVDSGFCNFLFLRYQLRPLFDLLVHYWLKRILRLLPQINIVWCFETNVIRWWRLFKKARKIFHVVDPIDKRRIDTANEMDLIVCVSNRILEQFAAVNKPKMFVNHALSASAIEQAQHINTSHYRVPVKIKAGYVGNLFRQVMEPALIVRTVRENPEVEFHFFGPYDVSDVGLGGEGKSLAHHLVTCDNVVFHGPVPSENIIEAISSMDIFLLAYKSIPGFYDSSNSHKIMEYWATGKVVVSTYIDQYSESFFADFIAMAPENESHRFADIFAGVTAQLSEWNSKEKMQKRQTYALRHTYRRNAEFILEMIQWKKN